MAVLLHHRKRFKMVITGDKSWVYGYDLENKSQSAQWKTPNSPRANIARMSQSNMKALATVFPRLHHEYAPLNLTVNMEYYRDLLRYLLDLARRKRTIT